MREEKELGKLIKERFDREIKPQAIKSKKPFFTNDPKITKGITFGERVFKREMNKDKARVGYEELLEKLEKT